MTNTPAEATSGTTTSTDLVLRRTPWDVILGILLVLTSFFLFGNAILATALSVFVFAWTSLFSGLVLLIGALFRIKSGGFWSAALGGAVLLVIGLFMLRNPIVTAVALTLMVGAMFFASGLVRVAMSVQSSEGRVYLIFSGLVSIGLGLWVMFNLGSATLTMLGIILAVQMLVEGFTLIMVGRVRAPKAA